MNELADFFRETIEDQRLSSSERKSLSRILADGDLSKHELNVLRSKLFDIAKEEIDSSEAKRILTWLEKSLKLLQPKSIAQKDASRVYFSPGTDCLNAIISNLQNARSSVDICVFTISDNRIRKEIDMCHWRKLKVRVLTDNDKVYDSGSDIRWLESRGIPVKVDETDKHMHHKFAIIDKEKVLTGSYNWTRSAEKYNEENILITSEAKVVRAYQDEFNHLWKKMQWFHD